MNYCIGMTLTVSQITQAIKASLESTFPNLSVQGEVSNCKLQASGHLYFSIKDSGAQLGAVMFRSAVSHLKQIPKDGDEVILKGDLNVYPPSGKYQIVARELQFAGVGELLLKLEELKKKLHALGWFKPEHKKPLPRFPKTIGVVTSPTGAAIQDIINVLTRRFSGFRLILNPVRVQGNEAPAEIAQAIKQFDTHKLVDVIIIGRGGGSIEDLWAFNDERVAAAVFYCNTPIIAAVGHETDHCIAEYVADVRAPTPSAAAEIAMGEKGQTLHMLKKTSSQINQSIRHHIQFGQQRLDDLLATADHLLIQKVREKKLILSNHRKRLDSLKPTTQIAHFKQKLHYFDKTLATYVVRIMELKRERLKRIAESLQSIDPKNLLRKGYSILFSEKDKSIITSVDQLECGQAVRTLFANGEALSTISEIVKK